MQMFVFREGWMVKNMHTAFDYIFNTQKKDTVCRKLLAGWTVKHADEYVGGIPPSSIGVKHKKDLLNPFLNSLLGDEKSLKEKAVLLFGCSFTKQ